MAAADILVLIAVVMTLAVTAEMLGDRLGVPNFLFFIAAGLAVGPVGLGLVHHDVFGDSLAIVVGLGVAVIIFHSGSGITRETVRRAPNATARLATIGVLVTFLGAAAVTYFVMDLPPGIALLIGALLVATGTTVIEPLLAAVAVDERLSYTLEIEATVTEVTAGILSVAVFKAVTVGEPDHARLVFLFGWVLVVGVVVGAVGGAIAWIFLTKPRHAARRAPKHAAQFYLATAVTTFAVAESIEQEAGVAAVATAGILLGNADLPYQEHISEFKSEFTTFIIAFVFVVLSSFVEPESLSTIGIEGLVVGLAVILVVRPLAVFLSTARSSLTTEEKLFLSAASPRGIIPAGVATLLALSIQDSTPDTAAIITGTVLLVIIVSAVIEGLFADRIADRFDLTVDTSVVVGGGRMGLSLADQYIKRGDRTVIVETDRDTLERARSAGFTAYHGDGADESVLRDAHVEDATRVVAATHDDETNREIAALVRSAFDVDTVLVRLNRRENEAMFADLDVELLTGSQIELWAVDHLTNESAPDWLVALTRTGGVGSVSVDLDTDWTVSELDQSLPDHSFLVSLTRDGETRIPDGGERVEDGDRLTLLGRSEAVEDGIARLGAMGDESVDAPSSEDQVD